MLFMLSGKSSILTADFNPPIDLKDGNYVLGLTNFETFNSIPNIDEGCNSIRVGKKEIIIPTGCYQVVDINKYIKHELKQDPKTKGTIFELTANNNTLHTHIKCSEDVDLRKLNSIAPLIGFKRKLLTKFGKYPSDNIANVMSVNSILVECNITVNSYANGQPQHIIHQFFPNVPPGFKIVESPDHVIYLPISVNTLRNIVIKIVDQTGKLINFQQETITVGLHLQKETQDGF